MEKVKQSTLALAITIAFLVMVLGFPGLISAGSLEPTAAPGPTMKTLDQIPPTWSQILPASERFELVMGNEAVLDKETGLVWAKDANIALGTKTWVQALIYCRNLNIGNRKGWRLPTVEELASLVDVTQSDPTLPSGHPFVNVQSESLSYWSSTPYEVDSTRAWGVRMYDGYVPIYYKGTSFYVWPVRGGN